MNFAKLSRYSVRIGGKSITMSLVSSRIGSLSGRMKLFRGAKRRPKSLLSLKVSFNRFFLKKQPVTCRTGCFFS